MTPRENRMRVAALLAGASAHDRARLQRLASPPSAATLASIRRAQQPKARSGRKGELNRKGTLSRLRAERVA